MNDIISVDDQLAKEMAEMTSRIQRPTANVIRVTQDKKFQLPDGSKTDGPIDMVIVDFINQNQFYEGAYNPKATAPPVCYAISKVLKGMAPGKNAAKPQASSCSDCPMNEFGSAGDGKACKNTILLAVLPPDATEDTPLMTIRVSPTALKNFNAYVATVSKLFSAPPIKVLTEVSFDPAKSYPSLQFGKSRPNVNYAVHFARRDEADMMLTLEPDAVEDKSTAAAPKPAKGGTRDKVRDSRA